MRVKIPEVAVVGARLHHRHHVGATRLQRTGHGRPDEPGGTRDDHPIPRAEYPVGRHHRDIGAKRRAKVGHGRIGQSRLRGPLTRSTTDTAHRPADLAHEPSAAVDVIHTSSSAPTKRATSTCVDLVESATLLALFPDSHMFGATEHNCFSRLARQGVLAGVLGPGMATHPGGGIRGGHLDPDDALNTEWAIVGLSPHTAGAMLARAIPDTRSEFAFAVTHDRRRVVAAARCLLRRLGPAEGQSSTDITWEKT